MTKRKIAMVANKVSKQAHDEDQQNREYWLSRPVEERLEALTRLRAQIIPK